MSSIILTSIIKTLVPIFFLVLLGCVDHSEKPLAITKPQVDSIAVKEVGTKASRQTLDSLKLNINFKPEGDYNRHVDIIRADRIYFNTLYRSNPKKAIDSASTYLYSKLLNTIVPHWYGTNWDFNGHTNIPNKGEIACGYFVSTTLKHLGFNLNRYKMAQQAGLKEAITLQPKDELKIFSNLSYESLREDLNSIYGNGIYFVGLDNHVGYVIIKDKDLYFLHSSYCVDKVLIEPAGISPCFDSNIYVFAEISSNKGLMEKWILNERLIVPAN